MQIQFCFSCNELDSQKNKKPRCRKFNKELVTGTNGFLIAVERCVECLKEKSNQFDDASKRPPYKKFRQKHKPENKI